MRGEPREGDKSVLYPQGLTYSSTSQILPGRIDVHRLVSLIGELKLTEVEERMDAPGAHSRCWQQDELGPSVMGPLLLLIRFSHVQLCATP